MNRFKWLHAGDGGSTAVDVAPLVACVCILVVGFALIATVGGGGIREDEISRLAGMVQLRPAAQTRPESRREDPVGADADERQTPLDIAQLDLALGASPGAGVVVMRDPEGRAARAADVQAVLGTGGPDQAPRLVSRVKPAYPEELRLREVTGSALVAFEVTPDGRVTDVRVEQSTDRAFDLAAVAAVRQWRFEPGRKGGKAVPWRMRIPIAFRP